MRLTDLLDDSDVQAIVLKVRNITEQKEQTDAKEILASYRACSEYAMLTTGLDGVILDWNSGRRKPFGRFGPFGSARMAGPSRFT